MKKTVQIFVACLVLLAMSASSGASPKAAYSWTNIADGINYTTFSFVSDDNDRTVIHAFSIDLNKHRMGLLLSKKGDGGYIRQMARKENAIISINGGFFTPRRESIGLIVKDGKTVNPIHKTSWWSIFVIDGTTPRILSPKNFKKTSRMKTALQVGPRLSISGKIPKLKNGTATRSAVGIARNGRIIIAATSGNGLSLDQMAHRMSDSRWKGGLECPNSMALDGGSSSQLYAKVGRFELSLPNIARITNGLAVFKK
jgi:uncharacterized protein YigE (DUF2233 family)